MTYYLSPLKAGFKVCSLFSQDHCLEGAVMTNDSFNSKMATLWIYRE